MMRRREFLGLLAAAGAAPARRPNIVLVLADDLGWADTTPYGADLHETPNLERLARTSVTFTRAYAAAPVCTPTRASIHTGKYPARLRMTIWRESARRPPQGRKLVPPLVEENLPHEEVTLAEALRGAGYFNIHIGKWHLGGFEHYPETHGFDVNIGGTGWGAPQSYFFPYSGTRYFGGEYRYVPGLHGGQPGEYLTDRLTSEAIRSIDWAGDRPFFLNLCYHTVHTPIEGKADLVERYRAKVRPGLRHRNPAYAAMVHTLDQNVGRLLDYLERSGKAANTLFLFTSDNGGFIGRFQGEAVTDNHPLRSGKGSLYEGGIRVPLLVRWPQGGRAGVRCSELVCSTDFYPTILEIAGLRPDPKQAANMDGVSFRSLLSAPAGRLDREYLFFHYPHYYETTTPVSAVMTREYKLLRYYEDQRVELYHLGNDPPESVDLSDREPAVRERLLKRLEDWLKSVNAQLPAANPAKR
jgi:arylsulfatase A